ncbi:hypothetical protein ACIRQP_02005 [Streptomyces sp. NPDC102274]|uniref:hypothetical protein n=1 Tax=Streptomyces sp. NPDC102274 TaxID=3366151 RepID=UPI0038181AF2
MTDRQMTSQDYRARAEALLARNPCKPPITPQQVAEAAVWAQLALAAATEQYTGAHGETGQVSGRG